MSGEATSKATDAAKSAVTKRLGAALKGRSLWLKLKREMI